MASPVSAARVPLAGSAGARHPDRRYFFGMAVAAALVVFAGFSRTFYLAPFTGAKPLSMLTVVHGVLFTLWMLLLVGQTLLVSARRVSIHRRVGVVGVGLAALMVLIGYRTATAAVGRGFIAAANAGVADPLAGLAVSLFSLAGFAVFVAAAVLLRRGTASHKRLMMLATINMLPAAAGRLPAPPAVFVPLIVGFILAGPVYDWVSQRRVHWAHGWGGLATFGLMVAPMPVGRTDAWHRLAAWLVG